MANMKFEQRVSKWDRAKQIAQSYGYVEGSFGYDNVVKQIFAKLLVGGKTIGKVGGKFKIG